MREPEPVKAAPEPVRQPEPAPAAKAEPTPARAAAGSSSSSSKPKSEEEELLDGLTEEELAQLLEETGLDKQSAASRAEPMKGVEKAVVFVYEDPAVKAEKKSQEAQELDELVTKIEQNAYEVPASVNLNSNE